MAETVDQGFRTQLIYPDGGRGESRRARRAWEAEDRTGRKSLMSRSEERHERGRDIDAGRDTTRHASQ